MQGDDSGRSAARSCIRMAGILAAMLLSLPPAHAATLAVSSGQAHNLAIHSDGSLRAWGNDLSGELGDGRILSEQSPTSVPGLANVAAVSAGFEHSVALMRDGTVWAWGNNDFGQLGDATAIGRSKPMPVPGLANIVAVSAGWFHTLALARDGRVWAWGSNYFGQLGDGTTTNRLSPVVISAVPAAIAVAAGIGHSVMADSSGNVWSWGDNSNGQIGDGTHVARLVPVRIAGVSGARAVSAQDHTLVLTTGGGVWAWGGNSNGILGDGTTASRSVPAQVPGLPPIVAIAAGVRRDLAIALGSTVWSWGQTLPGAFNATPAPATALPAGQLVSDGFESFVVTSSGSVAAWNGFSPAVVVSGISDVVSISAAAEHVVAVDRSGNVFAWGSNVSGQLGLGAPPGRMAPIAVRLPSAAVSVAAGSYHSAAVTADGAVWTWGANYAGMLGDGSFTDRAAPVQPVGVSGAAFVAAGDHHTVALMRDGTVYTWGGNERGQLGRSTAGSSTEFPGQVPGLAGVKAVAAGGAFSMALTADGTLFAWGDNARGQLGDGTTLVHGPATVLTGVVEIAAGRNHALAIKADGTVWAWGANEQGQLGDNSVVDRARPVRVSGVPPAVKVAASLFNHSLALAADGTVWGWGRNAEGELGDGTLVERHSPVRSVGLTGVTAIGAGWTHSTALKSDGTAWAWGFNASGQVGDGSLAVRAVPTVVIREDGIGDIPTNDWYLDLDPSVTPKAIPPSAVPAFKSLSFGSVVEQAVTVGATLRFRSQDVGQPLYVFAYAPSTLLKRTGAKDSPAPCQLAQLLPSGDLGQATASTLQSVVGNVVTSNAQAVSVLNNVSSSQVAGATLCVGTGATSAAAVAAGNSVCVATVPPATDAGPVCLPPGATAAANPPAALSGLWWNPGESGWGIDFTQRGSNVFAAWYTYDTSGNPKWYVASNCTMAAAGLSSGACSGTLYEVNGPTFFGTAFNTSAVHVATAGSLQVAFADANNATMSYTVAGQTRTVAIVREPLAAGTTPPAVDYTDLWWNPAESGWGLTIAQQFNVIFVAWYVYDSSGKPVWLVVPNCPVIGTGCTGALYRTTGPPFGPTFDTMRVHASVAGTATLDFSDPNNGTLTYTVDGVAGSKSITRELF